MRDELKYPRAFALMPVPIEMAYNEAEFKVYDCVYCYVVSPCYIVRRCTDYMQDEYGIENDGFEVVFPRKYLGEQFEFNKRTIPGKKLDIVPELYPSVSYINRRKKYKNTIFLDYNQLTEDYEEAIKMRDKENEKLVMKHIINHDCLCIDRSCVDDDAYKDAINDKAAEKIAIYNEEVNKYQEELNKLEPKEQVNKTGLIVKKYIIRKGN